MAETVVSQSQNPALDRPQAFPSSLPRLAWNVSPADDAGDVVLAPLEAAGDFGRALAACLQVDATCHNAFIQEQSLGIHYNQGSDLLDYLTDKTVFEFNDGFVKIPNGPGLGITIDEDHVKKMALVGHNWRNPLWRHTDNSVAEW